MIAIVGRAINRPFRKLAAKIYFWTLLYLGLLWVAAIWNHQGFAVGLMWFFGIVLLPVAYLAPANLIILSIAERLNRRDQTSRWDTFRVGVLLFICIMGAGGLALLLGMMSAGMAFPVVIPLILMIVAQMNYAGKANTERWMVVLSVIAAFIAIFSVIKVIPFGGVERAVYESTGYSIDVTPSRAEVLQRKALEKSRRLADANVAQCFAKWEAQNSGKVLTESAIAMANAECRARFPLVDAPTEQTSEGVLQAERENAALLKSLEAGCINKIKDAKLKHDPPLPLDASDRAKMKECSVKYKQVAPSSRKEGAGTYGGHGAKKPDGAWGWFMQYWDAYMRLKDTSPYLFWTSLIIGHFLFYWALKWAWKKLRGETTVVKVEKKSSGVGLSMFELMLIVTGLWVVLSFAAGTPITSWSDFGKIGEPKEQAEKVAQYPQQFMTVEEMGQWEARIESPTLHRFYGDMSGPLELAMLADTGKRADIVSQFGAVYGLVTMVDKLNPKKDIVINNNNCPAAKIPAGGNRYETICTSTGRSGDGSIDYSVQMKWTANERYATFVQRGGGETIRVKYTPKYP